MRGGNCKSSWAVLHNFAQQSWAKFFWCMTRGCIDNVHPGMVLHKFPSFFTIQRVDKSFQRFCPLTNFQKIFIKEDLTRSLWGRSRVRKSPFFNAVASLHTDTAVLDSIRNLCDVSIYNHCDSLKSVCYSNYFLSLWNKFPFFGPICEQTVGIKSSGSNMAESSPNSTSECLTACSINSQNVKNIFISHSWFQMESRQSK